MVLKRIETKEKYNFLKDLFLAVCLVLFAFVINAGISVKGLYQDDLYMWSTRRGTGFLEYVFPGSEFMDKTSKFRPVYWAVAWVYQGILDNNLKAIVPVNILIGAGIAIGVYFFAKQLSASRVLAFTAGIMFLASRFSYYNIEQFLGIMEAMAIIFALLMLYYLYKYINYDRREYFFYSCGLYFLNCFTHERFIVLFPMLIFAIIVKSGNRIINTAGSALTLLAVMLIRFFALPSLMPAGTGGTKISDTFTLGGFFEALKSEMLYLIGINAGPEHLNGIQFADVASWIKVCIAVANIFMVLFIVKLVIDIITNKDRLNAALPKNILLFSGFIIGSTVSSAVTFRVEMRWLYAPYVFMLLLVAYLYGFDKHIIRKSTKDNKAVPSFHKNFYISFWAIFFLQVWAFFMVITDVYYRGFYDKIYLFEGQHRANSLAEETYYKFDDGLRDRHIYIIGNEFELSKFDALEFFRAFDENANENIVTFVDSYRDIGQIDENISIIAEDKKNNEYINVTSFLKSIKVETMYGHYDDGWTDEEALLNVMSGEKGEIHLEIMYPGELTGNESIVLKVKDEEEVIDLSSNITYFDIEITPNTVIPLHFSSNFFMPDAEEQRGEKKLSFILNIKSQ